MRLVKNVQCREGELVEVNRVPARRCPGELVIEWQQSPPPLANSHTERPVCSRGIDSYTGRAELFIGGVAGQQAQGGEQ